MSGKWMCEFANDMEGGLCYGPEVCPDCGLNVGVNAGQCDEAVTKHPDAIAACREHRHLVAKERNR